MIEYVKTMVDLYESMLKRFPEYYITLDYETIHIYTKKWFGKRIGRITNNSDYALVSVDKTLAEKFNVFQPQLKIKLYHPDIDL